MPNFTAVTSKM